MTLTWAQRREELLRDCRVSPDVFTPMIDRLSAFVVPYQQALETEAAQRNLHLYLQGLLSHLPSKNAEVPVQIVKTGITPQLATSNRVREAKTEPLHPCAITG